MQLKPTIRKVPAGSVPAVNEARASPPEETPLPARSTFDSGASCFAMKNTSYWKVKASKKVPSTRETLPAGLGRRVCLEANMVPEDFAP